MLPPPRSGFEERAISSSWIVDAARRHADQQLAVAGAVLAALLALLLANGDCVREYFRGAHAVST